MRAVLRLQFLHTANEGGKEPLDLVGRHFVCLQYCWSIPCLKYTGPIVWAAHRWSVIEVQKLYSCLTYTAIHYTNCWREAGSSVYKAVSVNSAENRPSHAASNDACITILRTWTYWHGSFSVDGLSWCTPGLLYNCHVLLMMFNGVVNM